MLCGLTGTKTVSELGQRGLVWFWKVWQTTWAVSLLGEEWAAHSAKQK